MSFALNIACSLYKNIKTKQKPKAAEALITPLYSLIFSARRLQHFKDFQDIYGDIGLISLGPAKDA
jgi:hypothetical protein